MQPISCPYCGAVLRKFDNGSDVAFEGYLDDRSLNEYYDERQRMGLPPGNFPEVDFGIQLGFCSICAGFIVTYFEGGMTDFAYGERLSRSTTPKSGDDFYHFSKTLIIYPQFGLQGDLSSQVPEEYRHELAEAGLTLNVSPKASAALSRRLLERILTEEYEFVKGDLIAKIENFLKLENVPRHLRDEVDAVRNIGNFALHPSKSSVTGEIVDVEPEEAEWTLKIVRNLLHWGFVEKPGNDARVTALNTKLREIGKKEMRRTEPPH